MTVLDINFDSVENMCDMRAMVAQQPAFSTKTALTLLDQLIIVTAELQALKAQRANVGHEVETNLVDLGTDDN